MRQWSRQPDKGPVGQIKGLLSRHVYSIKESWKAALCLTSKGQKAACQRKSTTDKKERIAFSNSRWWCRRENWSRWWWWWRVRTSHADHKSMWQCFGVLGVKQQRVGLKRQPNAYTAGGGLGSHPTPNHVIEKRTVDVTFVKVITPTRRTVRNFQIFSHDCSTPNILYIIIFVSVMCSIFYDFCQ